MFSETQLREALNASKSWVSVIHLAQTDPNPSINTAYVEDYMKAQAAVARALESLGYNAEWGDSDPVIECDILSNTLSRLWRACYVKGSPHPEELEHVIRVLNSEILRTSVFSDPVQDQLRSKTNRTHSPDFRSVYWNGDNYTFSATQAKVVGILWRALENLTPEISQAYLETQVEVESFKDLFKSRPSWQKMIVTGSTKGSVRLAVEESPKNR